MTNLSTSNLGRNGPALSSVGFGAWAAGGDGWAFGWGPQDDNDSLLAMRRALDLGVNWIDTAPAYGLGHSEEVVGRLLKEIPPSIRPFVFTKCGMRWDERNRMAPLKTNLRPDSIRYEAEASARRLGVDCIDLFQFHWPDPDGPPVEDSWGEVARLVEEGKVRWAGVSNFDIPLLKRCERILHVDSLQPPFSLIHRTRGAKEIPWCKANGTGVIVYSPMQAGLLTEKWTPDRVKTLAPDDWRRKSRDFQSPFMEKGLALRDALLPIARRYGTSVAAVAVSWTLAWPGVTGAIAGARSPAQVEGWIRAGSLKLDSDDVGTIAAAIEQTGAGIGPTLPPE